MTPGDSLNMSNQKESGQGRPRGLLSKLNKFNTKVILVSGLSVILGTVLNVIVARQGIHRLSGEATREIEGGLNAATQEYLTNHIQDKAQHTNQSLDHAYSDLQILADIAQQVIDNERELAPVLNAAVDVPLFKDKLVYNPTGNWFQNGPDEPAVVSVWGYMGKGGALLPDVQRSIDQTALYDLVLPSFQRRGAEKLQLYYVGPHEQPFARLVPYTDTAGACDKKYPGHNEKNWYDFFFPGLVDSWKEWVRDPAKLKSLKTQITVLPPYEDAAGGGLVMTVFHPLWSKDRKSFGGSVGIDLTLAHLIESIKDVKLAQTGFAFLAQSDGNVMAVNDAGAEKLGLRAKSGASAGVGLLDRKLKDSADREVAAVALPQNDQVDYHEVMIGGEQHIIVLYRLSALNGWVGDSIKTDYWTLGFVVPRKEIYASLYAAQSAIEQSRTTIVTTQILITVGSIVLLLIGVFLFSRRLTSALVELSASAARMREGDYSVRVQVRSADEIGELSVAFNEMASEIQAYTNNLEELVSERTRALEKANQEISELNAKLAQENIRLGAELNVARQLQLMVLPAPQELEQIPDLDIAGYMAPADEVGGDYYDVLRSEGLVKIGIGDVTGHGLESGVLMLMVQTAVRTLLATGEQDPTRFLSIVNKVIYQNIQRINSNKNMSLTLLDYSHGTIKLTGQHEDLIIVRKDGSLERFDTMGLGMPIGLDLEIEDFISSAEIKMDPGDLVALFSDGITEAEDASSQQYGIDRLCEVIRSNHKRSSKEIKDAIIEDVLAHIGYNKVYDDITVLVIKRV